MPDPTIGVRLKLTRTHHVYSTGYQTFTYFLLLVSTPPADRYFALKLEKQNP